MSRLSHPVRNTIIWLLALTAGIFGPLFMHHGASEALGEERAKDISIASPAGPGISSCMVGPPFRAYQHGLASWYGPGFHGKKMANGRAFDMYRLTVAHKTLRLGTEVCITNKENGRSVRATVTDRGPYIEPRIIDLSRGVADQLGMTEQGVVRVVIALRKEARTM